jgi:hypothetical protein
LSAAWWHRYFYLAVSSVPEGALEALKQFPFVTVPLELGIALASFSSKIRHAEAF